MKIEFYDLETGKLTEGNYMVDTNGTVNLIETNCGEFDISEATNIGWRVVEEVKETELVVDWSKIDRIYKWVAMNEWGDLSAFVIKPKLSEYDGQWYTPVGFYVGSVDDCIISRPSPDKWRESLIQRPEGV